MVPSKPRIAVIGGYGGMGRLFAKVFRKDGFEVVITGPRAEKGRAVARELGVSFEADNRKAASWADITIITVPIRKTAEVIKEVAPAVRPGALLMDLTSIKKAPCEAMERFSQSSVDVIGMHPVFGPMVDDFRGQNIVLCKVRGGKWFSWVREYFGGKGARVTLATPEEHDEFMGVVQGMTHFMLFSAGKTLEELDFDPVSSKKFSSPVYQLLLDLIGRILAQDPALYCEIQTNNKGAAKARKTFIESSKRINALLEKGDEEGFIREMRKAAEHFGDTKGAMDRTSRMLGKNED
ncbi:MAG: prephenate dehydrogenase/arogenate dehydrogenase family protein [Candidatus Altiarchaeota archaeon]|nr:prephenate dehydrogenase/arogenate dehydrogenase family protein [Candidatus Altiarchaeota archaeon]